MDSAQRQQVVSELLARLGTETQLERLAARAGVPSIGAPGQTLGARYEQVVARLYEDSPEALAGYLEAAALEAGGGFTIRSSLIRETHPDAPEPTSSSPRRLRPPLPPPAAPPDAGAGRADEFTQLATTLVKLPPELRSPDDILRPSPLLPPLQISPEEEVTAVATLPAPLPPEVETLETLHAHYQQRRARTDAGPPVASAEHTMQLPSLTSRLRSVTEPGELEDALLSHARGELEAPPVLRDARFVAGGAHQGRTHVLCLIGAELRAPLFLELEGLTGRRSIERVTPGRAHLLLPERGWQALMPRRVRVLTRGRPSDWVDVRVGTRSDADSSWPDFRIDAAYVPAGDYRLEGEQGFRRLEQGIQLALTPVTNGQFQAFLDATGYRPEIEEDFVKHLQPGTRNAEIWEQPVVYVSHADARAYCAWVGGRLPSAEGWERAGLGLASETYPWGAEFDLERANTREGRYGWVTPVGRFPSGAGPYGNLDLSGNVWEWTESPGAHPDHHVLKGGSWVNDARCAALGFRASHRADLRAFYIGFRVCWSLPAGLISPGRERS